MSYFIGQCFGLISTVTCIVSPLFKRKWKMLLFNILTNACMALNLIFLQELGSGIYLFFVAIVQGILSLIHNAKNTAPSRWEKIIFLTLYLLLGFYGLVTAPGFVPKINGANLLQLLPIFGSVMSMCFIFAPREQTARKYILVCSAAWAVYTAIIGSTVFFSEIATVATTIYAMVKYKKTAIEGA